MQDNVLTVLRERGFIYQTTDDSGLEEILGSRKVTCYIGFDATAESLHVGSLVPLMALVHMQRCGHRPIALLGGGTTMVGDPSGRTELRKMLTLEQIHEYGKAIQKQFGRFLDFEKGALLLNNADWLAPLNYIEFLRDIGRHFSINRMLTAESVKQRLDKGLSFIEFNYMLLQAYDFYVLARDYDCELQMGGQDQWGNIVAGSDLTRRMINKQVYGITFPLLMNTSGEKFGKTAGGAVWLDAGKTPPFDFYQYWRNVDDQDVGKCLLLFTFLPPDEVKRICGQNINRAKEILAYEITKLVHGSRTAGETYAAAVSQFGSSDPGGLVLTSSDISLKQAEMPAVTLSRQDLEKGYWIVRLLVQAGLCQSNGEARRLIQQGGAYLNEESITAEDLNVTPEHLKENSIVLRAGKKRVKRVVFS